MKDFKLQKKPLDLRREKSTSLQNMNFYLLSIWVHFGFLGFTLAFRIRIHNPIIF
jgi:hypothetical protein